MTGRHFEFIKITDNKVLVTEIRPLKCQVNTSNGYKTTSKWMQFHHWKELKHLLHDAIEEYKVAKSNLDDQDMELGKMQRVEGKTIRIGFMYKAYKHCSCLYLTPREDAVWTDDEDDDDDEPAHLKDKGGRYNGLTPYGELLIVSVSCKEPEEEVSHTTFMKLERDFLKSLDPSQNREPTISDYFLSQSQSTSMLKPGEIKRRKPLKGRQKALSGKPRNKKKKDTFHTQKGLFSKKEVQTHSMKRRSSDKGNIETTGRKSIGSDAEEQQLCHPDIDDKHALKEYKNILFELSSSKPEVNDNDSIVFKGVKVEESNSDLTTVSSLKSQFSNVAYDENVEESNSELTTVSSLKSQFSNVAYDENVIKEESTTYCNSLENAVSALDSSISSGSTSFSMQLKIERENQYQQMEKASTVPGPSGLSLKDPSNSPVSSPSVLELSHERSASPLLGRKRYKSYMGKVHSSEISKEIERIKRKYNFSDSQVSESERCNSAKKNLPEVSDEFLKYDVNEESKIEEETNSTYNTRLRSQRLSKTLVPSVSDSSFSHKNDLSIKTINSQDLEEKFSEDFPFKGFKKTPKRTSDRTPVKCENQKLPGKKTEVIQKCKKGRKKRTSSRDEKVGESSLLSEFEPSSNTKLSHKSRAVRKKCPSAKKTKVDKVSKSITGKRKNLKRVKSESKGLETLGQCRLTKWVKRKKLFDQSQSEDESNSERMTITKSMKYDKSRLSTDLFASPEELSSPGNLNNTGDLDLHTPKFCEDSFIDDDDDDLPDLNSITPLENTGEGDGGAHCEGSPTCSDEKTVPPQGKENENALPENVKLMRVDHSKNSERKIDTGCTEAVHDAKPNGEGKSLHYIDTSGFENPEKPWKSLKDASSFLESLPEEELKMRIEQYYEYLLDVCKGKIPNDRHKIFNEEERWSKDMNYALLAGAYTEDQHEFVALQLYHRYGSVIAAACKSSSTAREYIWKVLVPTFLLKIVMDKWNLTNTEAEHLLESISLRSSNNS